MIYLNCKKCGHGYRVDEKYSGRNGHCSQCGHVNIVPRVYIIATDSAVDIPRADDGITPDFNALFMALLEQEHRTPALELIHR